MASWGIPPPPRFPTNVTITVSPLQQKIASSFFCKPEQAFVWNAPRSGAAQQMSFSLNVVVANSNITWSRLLVCRVDNTCTNRATIYTNISVGISLGTTGIKTHTFTPGLAGASLARGSDYLVFLPIIYTMMIVSQSFQYDRDAYVYTPYYDSNLLRRKAGSYGVRGTA